MGTPEGELDFMEKLLAQGDCVMVSPDYTLGLDQPYPAALKDAYAALLWFRDNAARLGADANRLIVVGGSAGGGLTAALCIYARDCGEVPISYQFPLFPMLDDRMVTNSSRDNNAPMWNSHSNQIAWELYLGDLYGSDNVPAWAAPARLTDFSNLPPAYSYVGSIEPFYDETRIYFDNLKTAGVSATLDVYEGGFHGFDTVGEKKRLGKICRARLYAAFRQALQGGTLADI